MSGCVAFAIRWVCVVGRRVLVLLPISRCAGLVIACVYGSVPALMDFCKRQLAVLTPDKALPLALQFPGLLVRCSKFQILTNVASSFHANSGPISLTSWSGIP